MNASLFILHARPFFLGESFPFAFLLLANERRPGLVLPIEGKLVRQATLLRIEPELQSEQVVIDLSATEGRVARAENIDPVTNIRFVSVIEADEHPRFIVGRCIAIPLALPPPRFRNALVHQSRPSQDY